MGKLGNFFFRLKIYKKQKEINKIFIGLFIFILAVALIFIQKINFYNIILLILLLILFIFLINSVFLVLDNKFELESKSLEFQSLLNSVDLGVIIYTPNFEILEFNKKAESIFELKAQEVLHKNITPELGKNPRFLLLTQIIFPSLTPLFRQLTEPNIWPQIGMISVDNPTRYFNLTLDRLFDNKKNIIGFIKIVQETTREKELLKSKNEFISVAAHQLRTPLTALSWGLETLSGMAIGEQAKEIVNEAYNTAIRGIKIVDDLLNVTKIEQGRFGYVFEITSLNEFLNVIIKTMEPVAQNYGIVLSFEPGEDVNVKIDKTKLSMAIANLIDNAIKYNIKQGRVFVKTEKMAAAPYVKITIEDTGLGISPEDLPKLFQKFYRGNNAAQINPNGSGLGLYITKNIIEQHGGKISVQSVVERGTTFTIALPLDFNLIPVRELPQEI
ncbi:MAG: sensor histidine kinase [Minisyncoccia bacterium]